MDASRFDGMTRLLAGRATRRAAEGGAAGLAWALGAGWHDAAHARDAVPAARSAQADKEVVFLFVQVFEAGTLVPKPDEDGVYELTLTGGPAQTIYFSDRPERIVGMVPTREFLDGLGFTPFDPPNAAVVAQTAAGEDVIVVELLNPRLIESFGTDSGTTLVYDVRVLADYEGGGLAFLASHQSDATLPERFGPASLFIDDCGDLSRCYLHHRESGGIIHVGPLPGGPVGQCWSWSTFACYPDNPPCRGQSLQYYRQVCNDAYLRCEGRCDVAT